MITIEQLKEVKERTESLNRYLDIDGKKMQYEEEQIRTQDPSFWEDAKRAEAQMKLVKGLEKWIKDYAAVDSISTAGTHSTSLLSSLFTPLAYMCRPTRYLHTASRP